MQTAGDLVALVVEFPARRRKAPPLSFRAQREILPFDNGYNKTRFLTLFEMTDRGHYPFINCSTHCTSSSFSLGAPSILPSCLPFLKKTNVGVALTTKRCARAGSASTSTLSTLRRPAFHAARSFTTGSMIRQYPHHLAQNSRSPDSGQSLSSLSKAAVVVFSGRVGNWSRALHWPQTGLLFSLSAGTRFSALQEGQRRITASAGMVFLLIRSLAQRLSINSTSRRDVQVP